ncbi:MAG: ABC transporter ATP-binding protein [Pseudomonadota bacterium]
MAEIRIEKLHKAFGDFVAVRDSTMTIEDGHFFVLLGPSGCGKTTTLRMIAGLEFPTSGNVFLDNEDVTYHRGRERDIAFVFQMFALYPHMNCYRNLAFPLITQGTPRREVRERVIETARLLRIEHLLKRPVGGLAAGDRQRIALGRAIIRRPKAFLMDEPLGALDTEFRDLMCQELRGLHNRIDATTVYVTHDQVEAMSMGDMIAVMHQGDLLQVAPPQELYDNPATLFVANFIGSPPMNFLDVEGGLKRDPGKARLVGGTEVAMPTLAQRPTDNAIVYGIRPEHILIDDHAPLRGRVFGVEYMGARQVVTVDTDAGRLKVRTGGSVSAVVGETVGLDIISARAVIFDQKTERALTRDTSPALAEAAHG